MDALLEMARRLIEDGDAYMVLLPIFVTLLLGERIGHALFSDRRWDNRDAAANIVITVVFLLMDLVTSKVVPLALVALLYTHARVLTLGEGAGGWLMAFLLYDLAWYVDHRLAHRTGLFWAAHHVHHSSNEYNMTVASRGFILDKTFLSRPLFYLLPLLGMSPFQLIVIMIMTNIWGIAQHTRLIGRLGPLDWIFATPSNHRVHHGCDEMYLDKNYGEVLIIWDRLFGSYQREEQEPRYGVKERFESYNPIRIEVAGLQWLYRKLKRARGYRAKLLCLVRPPDWDPAQQTAEVKEAAEVTEATEAAAPPAYAELPSVHES